jgi:diguanylate cyclase (GGDEF)-like protein
MRILIAEDDPVSSLVLARALEKLGHDVTPTADGESAWAAFANSEFPLVISDWMMPELDGLGLCRRIRSAPTDSYPFFVVLTAKSQRNDHLAALEAGADDFLAKPLDAADLQARLRTVERILGWQAQLQEVNKSLLESSREIAEKAAEISRMRDEANYMASHDPLTDLLNRRAWMACAEGAAPSALAIYDIDFFKSVNDRYGHPGGDEVLRAVAQRIDSYAGDSANVGRIGGEEFGVLWHTELHRAQQLAHDIVTGVEASPIRLADGTDVDVSVSGGFAPWLAPVDDAGLGMDRNYEVADRALYHAKATGRRRLEVHRSA